MFFLLEAEILASESFQLGQDIEKFYELHQQLSMDDLARRKVIHTKVCLVRVISKVLRHLDSPQELEEYLHCIGRLHQLAGVDQTYLALSGKSFCEALDTIQQHKELWSKQVSLFALNTLVRKTCFQVKATWYLLFKIIVEKMSEGYCDANSSRITLIPFEQR